jgi:hypothetical protein
MYKKKITSSASKAREKVHIFNINWREQVLKKGRKQLVFKFRSVKIIKDQL